MENINSSDANEVLNTYSQTEKPKNNKKKSFIIFGLIIFIFISITILLLILIMKDKNKNENENERYLKIRLKNWEFGSSEKINLSGEDISLGKSSINFYKAPEDFYVCTPMGGLSGHSNKYFYEKELQNIDKTQFDSDWWFKSKFSLKNIDKEKNLVLLHLNGINYKSDIYLDGKLVETRENIIGTFVKYSLDITPFIKSNTDNHFIAFKIKRPYNQWGGKDYNNQTDLAISFVDWNPEAPDSNMGIWQPVDIEFIPNKVSTISSAFVITELKDEINSYLKIVFNIKNWENKEINNTIQIQIGNFINYNSNISLKPYEEKQVTIDNQNSSELIVDNSKLWWPYQMGEPLLHNLTIKVSEVLNEDIYYIYTKNIGLRQVNSELDKENKRVYKINNKKLLLKGAGWTPDLFLRQSPNNYWNHISYVRDMELNSIRLEGKSEGEEFYEYCDKLGILVIAGWNCGDAWQRWEYWSNEVEQISNKSVISQIRKLSPHPSVIIFILGSDYAPENGIEEKWRKIFSEEKWPNEILSSAAIFSGEGFPTGVKMSGPYSWVPPNYFYLNETKNSDFGGAWGFLTEGGPGENPLRKGSIEKIFNKDNIYNYTGESWNYHCGNKGVFGNLSKLIKPINERYGNITNFSDFQRKSSAIVYESHRAMFEAYSCNKYNSTGIIQWMLNNAWPSNIWHLYDYFFSPTPAYFATKKAGERLHFLYNYENSYIYLLNNYFDDFTNEIINLNVYIISGIDGKQIIEEKKYNYYNIKGDEIKKLDIIKDDQYPNIYIIQFEYSYKYKNQNYFFTNTYWINQEMDELNLNEKTFYNVGISKYADLSFLQNIPSTDLNVEIVEKKILKNNIIKNKYIFNIRNIGNSIALLLEFKLYENNKEKNTNEIITPIFWNENYFSLRSGESYNISVEFNYNNHNDILLEIIGYNCEYTKLLNEL